MSRENRYTIEELEQITGVRRRTLRFYVQCGLLPPAEGRGKGKHYREEHVEFLERIREGQRQGKSLRAIQEEAGSGQKGFPADRAAAALKERRVRVCLVEGVWLEVEGSVLTPERLERLAWLCRKELGLLETEPIKILLRSRTGGAVLIPKALEDGTALRISPGESVQITELTPALQRAVEDGLIEIVSE